MKRSTIVILNIVRKLCLLAFIAAACMLVWQIYCDVQQLNTEQKIRDAIRSACAEELPTVPPEVPMQEPNPICAEALALNEDFIATLEAGEDIALYVVQGEDNSYYMNHDFFGNSSDAGTAFLDCRCSLEPRDTHHIIHGHNMRNGAVFGNLDKFRDVEYLKQYPIITYTTLYETEYYVPYAVLDISAQKSNEHYYKVTEWNFDTDEELAAFVYGLKSRSFFEIPVGVESGDALLTLSTCSYGYDNGRLLITCRRLRADETPEEMALLMQESTKA